MFTPKSSENSSVILVSSLQVFLNGSGDSIKLVISLNLIPGIGKLSTLLICFLNLICYSFFNYPYLNEELQQDYC